MLKIYQQTISNPVIFKGIGLHTGKKVKVTILPAKEDEGIIFKRVDLKRNNEILANYKNVISAKLCTKIKNKHGAQVSTVEHLLAALYIADIDNAIVEIDNEEVPIMDGSAKEFLESLKIEGTTQLAAKRKYLKILNKVEFEDRGRTISISPKDSLEVNFQLNYKNKVIGNQKNQINFSSCNLEDVYESRTFCLFEDIEKIKKLGLAKGGSLNNAIVVNEKEVLNKDGLRNEKEFVNHKILDLVGDFLLSGYRILGNVKCYQGGHELSNMFLQELFKKKSSFQEISLDAIKIPSNLRRINSIKVAVNA